MSDSVSCPRLSVIIPIYNGEADLPDLIACLQAQTYPVDRVEYLLIDNASRDRTAQLLQELLQSVLPTTAQFRVLNETAIQSAYAARNTGIRAATGDILVFTDADCRPQPNWLEHLVVPFNDPQVGLVAGEILALPGDTLLERYADRHETLSQKYTMAHSFCPYGQTANLAIRTEALQQVGLFRPYLTTGGDADICWRIQQQTDWTIQLAERAIVQHRHRATLADLQSQWRRYGRSNRYLHELHGIPLTRDLTPPESVRRWSRWLLKEVPVALTKVDIQQGKFTDMLDVLFDTPLGLICGQARSQGQRQAHLPDAARQIAWLDDAPIEKSFSKQNSASNSEVLPKTPSLN